MPSLNRVELMGYLGRDPEVRFTPTGKKVTTFSMAVDRVWKDANGQRQMATDWFQVEAWGRLGEICQGYLKKGRLVYVEGRLRTDQWQDKDKNTHYRTVVVARNMQMLGRPPEEPAELAEEAEGMEGVPE